MNNNPTICYHGDCHHLNGSHISDDNCLKRYIDVIDILSLDMKRIFVCNEYFRLKIRQDMSNYDLHLPRHFKKYYHWDYKDYLWKEIIIENTSYTEDDFFSLSELRRTNKQTAISMKADVTICERPFIVARINALDIYNRFTKLSFDDFNRYEIFKTYENSILNYFINTIEYVSNRIGLKSYHKEAVYLKNNLRHGIQYSEEFSIRLNSFLIESLKRAK